MTKVYFCSDLHIGHKNIHKFRSLERGFPLHFEGEAEHREWLYDWMRDNIRKRDLVYMLGDIAFNEEALLSLKKHPFRKVLVKGNHDILKHAEEHKVYDQVLGLGRYKGHWLSHAPIHPAELRGRVNFQGHVHNQTLPDKRYQNCCVEEFMKVFNKPIVPYEEIIQYRKINYYED